MSVANVGVNFAGDQKIAEDDKNYKNNVEKEKESLRKQVIKLKNYTIKDYEKCLNLNIENYQYQIIDNIRLYIDNLFSITVKLDKAIIEILKIKQHAKQDFDNLK